MPAEIIIVLDAGHATLRIDGGDARFIPGLVTHQPIISLAQIIAQQPQLLVFGPSAQLWLKGPIDGSPNEAFYLTLTLPRGHNGNSSFNVTVHGAVLDLKAAA